MQGQSVDTTAQLLRQHGIDHLMAPYLTLTHKHVAHQYHLEMAFGARRHVVLMAFIHHLQIVRREFVDQLRHNLLFYRFHKVAPRAPASPEALIVFNRDSNDISGISYYTEIQALAARNFTKGWPLRLLDDKPLCSVKSSWTDADGWTDGATMTPAKTCHWTSTTANGANPLTGARPTAPWSRIILPIWPTKTTRLHPTESSANNTFEGRG